ncbi:MAG TPA: HD domain-containing phosphohydrolase [Gemmatimonadaceae bacterium]|nr:HD domain-containing phosphohydrolase [Gemmatimonadaceae bacterium]
MRRFSLPVPLTLQTRLGRRIALLFVVSALVPVAVMGVQGYAQVTGWLTSESRTRLNLAAKSIGMGIVAQLGKAHDILTALPPGGGAGRAPGDGLDLARAHEAFASLAVVTPTGQRMLWGTAPDAALSADDARRVAGGAAVLQIDRSGRPWMVVPAASGAQLWGALDTTYLFNGARVRAAIDTSDVTLCIRAVGTSAHLPCSAGHISGDDPTGFWDVFLKYDFGVQPWRVTLSQPLASVLAPVHEFQRTFGLSILTVVALVVLLTSVQVRRSLKPLAEFQLGMQRVAQRDFSSDVQVSSGDEFEDLAHTFNRMSGEIDQQFRAITAGSAIDQTSLASRRGEDVAATAATRLQAALQCPRVNVYVAGDRPTAAWRCISGIDGMARAAGEVWPPAVDLERLAAQPGMWLRKEGPWLSWLQAGPPGPPADAVLTLVSHGELLGLIALFTSGPPSEEQARVARQLADQVSVGLANSRLITRLNGLSYGALAALARTVDANSHWTAGHSERVTALSMRMARRLRLPETELDTLHRGGLLHDIGKIGVPGTILDFAGPLDAAGMAAIRSHPELGAKILAPIAAFRDAIPIVRYHHERVDGAGYPEQLKGGDIPFLPRLLAVADVYDALVSDRPYRPGWSSTLAIDTIRSLAGAHFDPAMVDAFLGVISAEGDGARFSVDPLAYAEVGS